jgi:hypothetical protein
MAISVNWLTGDTIFFGLLLPRGVLSDAMCVSLVVMEWVSSVTDVEFKQLGF